MKKINRLIPTWKITRVSFVFSFAYCSRIKWSYLMLRKSSIRLRLSYFMNTNHFVANHFPHCRLKKKKKIILVPMRGTWNTKSRIRNSPLCFTFSSEVFIICKSINRRSSRLLVKRKLSSLNCYEIFFLQQNISIDTSIACPAYFPQVKHEKKKDLPEVKDSPLCSQWAVGGGIPATDTLSLIISPISNRRPSSYCLGRRMLGGALWRK